MNTLIDKKENRGYIVWSIAIGALFGFLVNILSNIYYGFYITQNLLWKDINHFQFYLCVSLLVGLVGYLQFFIYDYPNTFEFSKAYWKRYQSYFFYKFYPGKIARVIIGGYLILLLIGLLLTAYLLMAQGLGYGWAAVVFGLILTAAYFKEKSNRKNGK